MTHLQAHLTYHVRYMRNTSMNVDNDTIAVCGGIPHAACGANHGGSGTDVVPTPKISVSTASISFLLQPSDRHGHNLYLHVARHPSP